MTPLYKPNIVTSIPTGVFKISDGYINIATTGGRIWERCAQAIGAPELFGHPICDGPFPLQEPRRAQRRDRAAHGDEVDRDLGPRVERGRRNLRADQCHRPDVRGCAGQASSVSRRTYRTTMTATSAWSASPRPCHARRAEWWRGRRNSASRPTRYSPNSASTRKKSLVTRDQNRLNSEARDWRCHGQQDPVLGPSYPFRCYLPVRTNGRCFNEQNSPTSLRVVN